uniref:Uncharacterized protein n=1 Tax=Hucho hucho TaxID=62062 RepID=A0A4W5LUE9_9TELE
MSTSNVLPENSTLTYWVIDIVLTAWLRAYHEIWDLIGPLLKMEKESQRTWFSLVPLCVPQDNCSLTHLNLAGNGLMDGRVSTLARCLPVCTSMVSVDLSWNPAVTSVGLHSILSNQRPLAYLNLQGTVGL